MCFVSQKQRAHVLCKLLSKKTQTTLHSYCSHLEQSNIMELVNFLSGCLTESRQIKSMEMKNLLSLLYNRRVKGSMTAPFFKTNMGKAVWQTSSREFSTFSMLLPSCYISCLIFRHSYMYCPQAFLILLSLVRTKKPLMSLQR